VIEYVDTAIPDFRLRVFPTGRKVWAVYCYSDGRRRWVQLRPAYPHLGAEEARQQATVLRKGTAELPAGLGALKRAFMTRSKLVMFRGTSRSTPQWCSMMGRGENGPIGYRY
jgi:Arm domain-containing DNA-binding protein